MNRLSPRLARATLVTACLLGGSAAPAHAAPGVPAPPVIVYTENFEHVANPTTPELLTSYIGAPPVSEAYTADPSWVGGPFCNGIITSFNSADFPGCGFNAQIRLLAQGLGTLSPGDPNQNHALSAYTSNDPGVDAIEFETVQPIALSATSRFVSFSVDSAVINCFATHPLYKFYLTGAGPDIPTFTSPIDPCTDPRGQPFSNGRVGRFASDTAVLFTGSSLGIRLRNGDGSGSGNDAAIDNISVLDSTPTLDKSFSPASVRQDQTSILTFTVTNTTDLAFKGGLSFTDALAPGLTVAAGPATTTCTNGVLTAPVGATSVSVTGDLAAGQSFCTASVPVKASATGSYPNGPANITSVGLNPPQPSALLVTPPDTTPPSCGLTAVVAGPPKQLQITAQDSESGISSITVSTATNANVPVPPFTPGTTDPVVVTATKIDQSMSAQVALQVTDVSGNVTTCDPVLATVGASGKMRTLTVPGVARAEHLLTVKNGAPGLRVLKVEVNGHRFWLNGLRDGQSVNLDLAQAMRPGDHNTITLKGNGRPGASADVAISDD